MRDAVDADSALTNAPDADGEVVWSWRPEVGVKPVENIRGRRCQQNMVTEESTKETVKTIARGMPDVPA